jgi:hypothetical protein
MEDRETDIIVGMRGDDGSVKCRKCISEEEWNALTQQNAITLEELESGERLYYCDYCEERL